MVLSGPGPDFCFIVEKAKKISQKIELTCSPKPVAYKPSDIGDNLYTDIDDLVMMFDEWMTNYALSAPEPK